jgi:parallel beta-helix repeat protein
MKQKKAYLLGLSVLIAFAVLGQTANQYYVDGTKATNGDGTAANPWNRIWYAVNRTRDTTKDAIVFIKRGTYTIDSTNFLTQLFIGAANGGANGKYLTLRTYPGDEGKVFIDGSKLKTTSFYPNMMVISGAKFVKLENLVFRSLKNTNGYVLNVQNAQNIEIRNCAFDTLRWTTTVAEYGYPTVNNQSNFIDAIYLQNSSSVIIANDTLRNSAPGWGELVRDAGGNTGITQTAIIRSNVAAVASNYYVALNGNDTTGSGSIAKPWRTGKRALELAGINFTFVPSKFINAPVTIFYRAGTHKPVANGLYIDAARGANGQWLTIRNYPGENVILDGSNINTKYSALISVAGAKNVRIEGLKLTKMTNDSALQFAAPGLGLKDTRFGIIVSGKAANIVIKKNEIYDIAWTRNLAKQKIPTSFDNVSPLIVIGTTDTSIRNVVIDSNTVYNNVPGYSEAVTINGNVDSFAITNNLVFDNANIGIVAAGNYQYIVDDPNYSVTAPNNFSRNGFIRNNTAYRNISPIAVSAGIYLDGSRNVKVENNLSYNNGTGISIGNEQYNSISGYHLVQNNVFRDNLTAGLYLGSTNLTSWVENCTVKNNTVKDNFLIDPVLRARANNQYGVANAADRYTEVNVYRVRNSIFEQNTIESLSDYALGLFLTQTNNTLRYNTYYVISEDACKAIFVRDTISDTSFHRFVLKSGYDQTSSCEGQTYNPTGCGTANASTPRNRVVEASNEAGWLKVYPSPVISELTISFSMAEKGTAVLELLDMSGRLVLREQKQLPAGAQQFVWNRFAQQRVKPGTYLLRLITTREIKTHKILIQ